MCGRYGLYDVSESDILKENTGYHFKPNYNVTPSQTMPVIVATAKGKAIEEMKWGIHRVVGPQIEKDIINTRADKAFGRFWGKNVRNYRCLVPANGFYEWKSIGKEKMPYWIHPAGNPIFMFAGIYQKDNDGKMQYSIMTTEPNAQMKTIHNRMPVILNKSDEEKWLTVAEDESISNFLRPYHEGGLEIYEVTKEVNSPKNNSARLLKPI